LDIFSFNAIYAPTAQFNSTIASDEEMQRECACYVNTRFAAVPVNFGPTSTVSPSSSVSRTRKEVPGAGGFSIDGDDIWPALGEGNDNSRGLDYESDIVDGVGIVELYASLKQGQSVRQWYLEHMRPLANIDVRRFITFGIIKGFLYRVHKYAYATGGPAQHLSVKSMRTGSISTSPTFSRSRIGSVAGSGDVSSLAAGRRRSGAFFNHHPYREEAEYAEEDDDQYDTEGVDDDDEEETVDDKTLTKYLDGTHCFDEICTELEMSEKELTARLKRYPGEVLIIHR
jgi:hypothetical protein